MIQSAKILGSGILYYSTSSSNSDLQSNMNHLNSHLNRASIEPWFITGFTDGEGCFSISVYTDNGYKIGWCVRAIFSIVLSSKDKALLEQIQSFFGVGGISKNREELIQYRVESIKELRVRHKSFR